MVRFMTLSDSGGMKQAKLWYYLWFTAFYCMATGVGLLARIYLADTGTFDAELALPSMAQQLLPGFFVGDSLILSCSAAITHDILPHTIEKTTLIKFSTIGITAIALLLALSNNQSVFNMVIMAWSGLASAFAPLLIFLCLGKKPSQVASITAVVTGFCVALLWRYCGLHAMVYEGLPGILAGAVILAVGLMLHKPSTDTT